MKNTNCKGCEVRREVVLVFGGFDKYGYCVGCQRANNEAETHNVRMARAEAEERKEYASLGM